MKGKKVTEAALGVKSVTDISFGFASHFEIARQRHTPKCQRGNLPL